MSEQIEQLKSDKAALEAAQEIATRRGFVRGQLYEHTIMEIAGKIAELEKQAADPWQDAKEYLIEMELHLSASYWQNVVAKYVRHLEEKVEELESQSEHKPLWAVVSKGDPSNIWRTNLSWCDSINYRIFLTRQKAEVYAKDNDGKVVPIWGE